MSQAKPMFPTDALIDNGINRFNEYVITKIAFVLGVLIGGSIAYGWVLLP